MSRLKILGRKILTPLVVLLTRMGVSPTLFTLLGIFFSLFVSISYAKGWFPLGGILLLVFSIFDTLDGEIARKGNRVTHFGAFLDSTSDRIQEGFLFIGLLFFARGNTLSFILIFTGFLLAYLISYTRARGEGLGYSTRKGPMERAHRIVWIGVSSLFGYRIFVYLFIPFIILNLITVFRRIMDLKRNLLRR